MARYNVTIFPTAQQDLKEVVDYINELSPDAAVRAYDDIVDSIITLEDHYRGIASTKLNECKTMLRPSGLSI